MNKSGGGRRRQRPSLVGQEFAQRARKMLIFNSKCMNCNLFLHNIAYSNVMLKRCHHSSVHSAWNFLKSSWFL